MAQTLYCDDHPEAPAVMIVTNLIDGEVATLCGGCVGPWCLALAQAVMPDAFQDIAVGATAEAAAPGEGEAAQDPPRPKRRRGGRQNGSGADPDSAHSFGGGDVEFAEEIDQALSHPSSPFQEVATDDS
jgi:hypothetical protein